MGLLNCIKSESELLFGSRSGGNIARRLTVLPALVLSGLMLGALGMLISSVIKQLENFAGVMNFVIFPMFFASSALYPLWRVREGSPLLYYVCQFNPFTHAVELIRMKKSTRRHWRSWLAARPYSRWPQSSPTIRRGVCSRGGARQQPTHDFEAPQRRRIDAGLCNRFQLVIGIAQKRVINNE